jgi:hypothetical protein
MRKSSGYYEAAEKFGADVFPFYLLLLEQIEEYHPENIKAYFHEENGYYFCVGAIRMKPGKKTGPKKRGKKSQ